MLNMKPARGQTCSAGFSGKVGGAVTAPWLVGCPAPFHASPSPLNQTKVNGSQGSAHQHWGLHGPEVALLQSSSSLDTGLHM